MIEQSLGKARLRYWLLDAGKQSLPQSPQGGHQIAAIHRRNEARRERLQSSRVVPVQHVSAILRNPCQRGERALRLHRHFGKRQIAEFACNLLRVEEQIPDLWARHAPRPREAPPARYRGSTSVLLGAVLARSTARCAARYAGGNDFLAREFFARNPRWPIQP